MFDRNYHVSTPLELLRTLKGKRIDFRENVPIINRNVTRLLAQHGSGAGMSAAIIEFVTRSETPGQIELDQIWMENLTTGMEARHVRRVKIPTFKDVQVEGKHIGMVFFVIASFWGCASDSHGIVTKCVNTTGADFWYYHYLKNRKIVGGELIIR